MSKDEIEEYFKILQNAEFFKINPKLIINFDEIGFGASRSDREKSTKVLVKSDHVGLVFYCSESDSRLISALVAITCSGKLLKPAVVIQLAHEHPDSEKCPFFNKMLHYTSDNSFITKEIFENFMMQSVINYIEKARIKLNNQDAPAAIIYDGHKSHISNDLSSLCAEKKIKFFLLPPHSSHLLQPLDQVFFRKTKAEYGNLTGFPNVSVYSGRIQKIFTALQCAANYQTIILSWRHVGIIPVIENGEVTKVTIEMQKVLEDPALKKEDNLLIQEKARGRPSRCCKFGLLNEIQIQRIQQVCCPFCGKNNGSA